MNKLSMRFVFGGFYLALSSLFLYQSADGLPSRNFVAYLSTLFFLVFVAGNIGVMGLKKWGRIICLYLVWPFTILTVVLSLVAIQLYGGTSSAPIVILYAIALLSLIMAVGSTIYLTSPKIKEQFK